MTTRWTVLKYCRQLPDVDTARIGLWGISQAGWVIPRSVARDPAIAFAILVSPAGVNPARQVEFYMENEFRKIGLNQDELREASQLNRAVMKYYGSGDGYDQAQMLVSQAHGKDWFEKVRKHPFWHEMPSKDRIFTPVQLTEAIRRRRNDFSWYTAPSTFADYSSDYSRMKIPLLIVHGGRDELVPVQEAISVFKKALAGHEKSAVTFRTFDRGDHNMQISPTELVRGYIEEITAWIAAVS